MTELEKKLAGALRDTTAGCFCDPECPTCARNREALAAYDTAKAKETSK